MAAPVTPANAQVPADRDAPVVLDFGAHALRVALVARPHVLKLNETWNVPGIYILLGALGTGSASQAYIGKAIKLRQRLNHHRTKPKLSWWRGVAISRDTTAGFNSSEIGYLEGRLYSELVATPAIDLKADKHDHDTTLPQHMLLQLDVFIPTILAALRVAGLDISNEEPVDDAPASGASRKQIKGTVADLLAAGLVTAGAPLIFKRAGKTAEATVTSEGQLVVDGKAYGSPSRAAADALGLKATNGWVSWELANQTGVTLADLRAQLPSS